MSAKASPADALALILAEMQALRADLARASSPFLTTAEDAVIEAVEARYGEHWRDIAKAIIEKRKAVAA